MSKKIRISELAQEINSTNKRVMELLARIGIKVSNASSSLTEEQAEQFYESINFKRGDKDADNSGSANAADKTAAARAAAAQSAQGGIKDPKQAQPVIRRVVVHNSGSRSDSYSNKSGGSVQAPSGLRQGLVLTQPKPKDKAEDAAPAEPAPEAPAKTGGGVRRIPRKAPASGTPTAAPAADKAPAADTAAPAAETASAPAAEATAENKPAVKRIRRMGKPEGEAAAAPAASAAAETAPDKTADKPADKVEVQPAAPEKAPETAAASAPDKAAETTAAAPAKAVDTGKPAKSEASAADNASEKAEGAANVPDKAAEKAEKAEKAADAAPAPEKAPDTAPAVKTEKAEPTAAAPASAAAKTPAADAAKASAPVRRGPVYISRARDAAPGTRPAAAADTRTPARTGRPAGKFKFTSKYLDAPVEPLFPFGFGLSYTNYQYSDISAVQTEDGIHAEITVQNTGDRAGDEIVQCYFRDPVAQRVRPTRKLAAFEKVTLQPNESKRISFDIPKVALGYYDQDMNFVIDDGLIEIYIGGNVRDTLRADVHFLNH